MKAHEKEDALDRMFREEEEKLGAEGVEEAPETAVQDDAIDGTEHMDIPMPDPDPWAVEELKRLTEYVTEENERKHHGDKIHLQITQLRPIAEASDIYNISRAISNRGLVHYRTMAIVNKLWHNIPLTPIEDTEDQWAPCKGSETEDYHKRAPYVIREKQPDGTYKYSDEQRILGFENGQHYYLGSLIDILNELEPISFPYVVPDRKYFANTMSFLSAPVKQNKKKNLYRRGSAAYDTFGIFSIVCPDGRVIPIGKYYKWDEDGVKKEIEYAEFLERRNAFTERVEKALKKAAEKEKKDG